MWLPYGDLRRNYVVLTLFICNVFLKYIQTFYFIPYNENKNKSLERKQSKTVNSLCAARPVILETDYRCKQV